MGILVKLVYELKGTAEESPSLPPETLPITTLQDLQVLEGQLHDHEFKKTLVMYMYNTLLSNYTVAHPVSLSKTCHLFLLRTSISFMVKNTFKFFKYVSTIFFFFPPAFPFIHETHRHRCHDIVSTSNVSVNVYFIFLPIIATVFMDYTVQMIYGWMAIDFKLKFAYEVKIMDCETGRHNKQGLQPTPF